MTLTLNPLKEDTEELRFRNRTLGLGVWVRTQIVIIPKGEQIVNFKIRKEKTFRSSGSGVTRALGLWVWVRTLIVIVPKGEQVVNFKIRKEKTFRS